RAQGGQKIEVRYTLAEGPGAAQEGDRRSWAGVRVRADQRARVRRRRHFGADRPGPGRPAGVTDGVRQRRPPLDYQTLRADVHAEPAARPATPALLRGAAAARVSHRGGVSTAARSGTIEPTLLSDPFGSPALQRRISHRFADLTAVGLVPG